MPDSPKTRASLILRLRDRSDLQAWQEFTEIYQPLVFRLARRKGFQHSDAMDVAQEVILRVANAVERWEPDRAGSFRGWLYRIARNLMIDFLDKGRRVPVTAGNTGMLRQVEQQVDPASADSQLFDVEFRRQVFAWAADRIRGSFKESTWNAFWLTAVEQQAPAAVSERLGLSVGAIYIARTRVMQRLRGEVQRILTEQQLEGGQR